MIDNNPQRLESTSGRRRMYIGPAVNDTEVSVHWYRGPAAEGSVPVAFELFDKAELIKAINALDNVTATYEKPFTLPTGIGAVIRNHVNTYVRTASNCWAVATYNSNVNTFTDAEILEGKNWEIVSEGVAL